MKDLADRIEKDKQKYDSGVGFAEKCRIVELLGAFVFDHFEAITKSLRFSEHMQTLGSVDVQIERGDQPDDQWLITIYPDGEEIQVQHLDIFEAASHAVAEIGKGEA